MRTLLQATLPKDAWDGGGLLSVRLFTESDSATLQVRGGAKRRPLLQRFLVVK